MRQKISNALIALGILFFLIAGGITVYNLYTDGRAGELSGETVNGLESMLEEEAQAFSAGEEAAEQWVPPYPITIDPDTRLARAEINGNSYIGLLEIPALALSLPIMSDWSYPKLRIAPCRYKGSLNEGNLIILAHNYESHFGKLKFLTPGTHVSFKDVCGRTSIYEVLEIEELKRTAVEEMEAGNWELTLFTCTIGGRSRVTVRCRLVESGKGFVTEEELTKKTH